MATWQQIAALPNPRYGAGVCFHDDKAYVLGGLSVFTGGFVVYETTTYIYDPAGNTWSTGPALPTSGLVYAFSTATDGIHIVYPVTGVHYAMDPDDVSPAWATRTSAPAVARRDAFHFTDADGLFYLAGGRSTGSGTVADVDRYDPDTDSWTSRADMPAPVSTRRPTTSAGILGSDDNVYLGQASAPTGLTIYTPGTDTWATTADIPDTSALNVDVSRLPSGTVLTLPHSSWAVAGGGGSAGLLRRIDGYDPDAGTWTMGVIPDYPASNYQTGIATEPGGIVYLLGGLVDNSAGIPSVTSTSYSYKENEAPTAPTPRTLTGGVTVSTAGKNRASWTFNDPNVGDSQSAFNFYYRIVGDASWTLVERTSPNPWYDFDAGTLDPDDYEWQVEVYDAGGEISPRTTSALFTAADPPNGPSITYPINGQTVEQLETTVWSAPAADAYELRRVADVAGVADPSTIYFDTGEVAESLTRSLVVEFDTNDRFEHVQVRVKFGGLWSDWASVQVDVSYTPPPTPTFAVYPDATTGSLLIMIANPEPVGDEPAAAYNDVYVDDGAGEERKVTELATNTGWRHWTPVSGRDYAGSIRVVAVAANGTTASSA